MNAIEIKGLTKKYPGFHLDDINLRLPTGSIMGLVGENGAGKSTTIRLIMNAVRADSGEVFVLGKRNTDRDFCDIKEDVGVVLDEAYFPEMMSAKNVAKMMSCTYKRWDDSVYRKYIERFELPEKKLFKDYSRGMKMKLAIAVALSHDPKLLILDEATSGLDPIIRDEILDIFNDFTRDDSHSILISSHIVSDLEKICDYIAFLHRGKLVLCEEKDRLLEEYVLARLPERELERLPKDAVIGKKSGEYGAQALLLRSKAPATLEFEHTTLEDVILFLAKEGEGR